MRKVFGFLLLTAGVAFGLFAYFPDRLDRESQLAEMTAIVAAPAGTVSHQRDEQPGHARSFSPSHPLTLSTPAGQTTVNKDAPASIAAPPAPVPALPPVVVAQQHAPAANGWQTVVTPTAPGRVTSSTPGDGHARYELVLDIQRELKRAGCYGGALSGSWNANTKRAMSEFMSRANATLPIEEPDYILLTLVKGHTAASCITCPLGQTLSEGRCVAKPVLAQPAPATTKPEAPKIAARPEPTSRFSTTTAPAPSGRVVTAARPAAPLPGRMAIGGPAEPPAAVAAPAPAPPATAGWQVRLVPSAPSGQAPLAAPAPQPAPTVTAALEPDATEAADGVSAGEQQQSPGATLDGTGAPSPSPRAQKPRNARAPARSTRTYRPHSRSVQTLFTHPLGRM